MEWPASCAPTASWDWKNVALWHERDISHSSAERVVLPDSSMATDYMLQKMASLVEGLVVYPERMLENLAATRGSIFSGQLLLALTQAGVSREEAYEWVQRNAMKAWDEGGDLQTLVTTDKDIAAILSAEQIAKVFTFDTYLRNVAGDFCASVRVGPWLDMDDGHFSTASVVLDWFPTC